jgi:hypothetical protein
LFWGLKYLDPIDLNDTALHGTILLLAARSYRNGIIQKIAHDINVPLNRNADHNRIHAFHDFFTLSQHVATTVLRDLHETPGRLSDILHSFSLVDDQSFDTKDLDAKGIHGYRILRSLGEVAVPVDETDIMLANTYDWDILVPYYFYEIFMASLGSLNSQWCCLLPLKLKCNLLEVAAHYGDSSMFSVLYAQLPDTAEEECVCISHSHLITRQGPLRGKGHLRLLFFFLPQFANCDTF